jgi:hypothetical protein
MRNLARCSQFGTNLILLIINNDYNTLPKNVSETHHLNNPAQTKCSVGVKTNTLKISVLERRDLYLCKNKQ